MFFDGMEDRKKLNTIEQPPPRQGVPDWVWLLLMILALLLVGAWSWIK